MPNKKTGLKWILILLLVLAVIFVIYFYNKKQANAPVTDQTAGQSQTTGQAASAGQSPTPTNAAAEATPTPKATGSGTTAQGTFSAGEGDAGAPDIVVLEVDFDGSKFTPNTVNIKVGDWVFFKNKSQTDMRVASNPHPTHTDYPGFDSLTAIGPGKEYKFQFMKAGSWGYHDHFDPSIGGTVVVSAK